MFHALEQFKLFPTIQIREYFDSQFQEDATRYVPVFRSLFFHLSLASKLL